MKQKVLMVIVCVFSALNTEAQIAIAEDSAANYAGSWTNGSNGGYGFTSWDFNMTQGSNPGSAGVFVGDPSTAGVTGMSPQSFAFYANPLGTGANSEVSRGFLSPLTPGATFSFQWGLNWDSDSATSSRGFNLLHGASQLINLSMGNSSTITINNQPMFTQFGTQAFTINFEQLTPSSLRVYGVGRDGTEVYDNTFLNLTGPADSFVFYFNATSTPEAPNQDYRQMYVNNLEIVPEPSSIGLLLISAVVLMAYRSRAIHRKSRPL